MALVLPAHARCEELPGGSSTPAVKPAHREQDLSRFRTAACPAAVGAVTPGSLADQFNREADGRDPASFFYPHGY